MRKPGTPPSATPNVNYPRIHVKTLQDGRTIRVNRTAWPPEIWTKIQPTPAVGFSRLHDARRLRAVPGQAHHRAPMVLHDRQKSGAKSHAQIFHGRIVVYLSCLAGVYPGMS